ncbi:MAG: GAF and ANTAR domain-containing protein [Pseudonocardiaceae bacterium]
MSGGERGRPLAEAFVALADTLVADFDVIDLLHRLAADCVDLLTVAAAGLLLSDQRGNLRVVASSSEQVRLLELFQLQTDEGPCLDCVRSGLQVTATDPADITQRWPRFAVEAARAGFRTVHALPMRLRSETIGALNLFHAEAGPLAVDDLKVAQALADVATIGILQERTIRDNQVLAEQLQTALNSRVIIEQAKGALSERCGVDMAEAFSLLRAHARRHNQRLSDVARAVVEDSIPIDGLRSVTRKTAVSPE